MARVTADGRNGYCLTLADGKVWVRSRYTFEDGLYCITRELLNLKQSPEFYAVTRRVSIAMHIARQACAEWQGMASVEDRTRTLTGTISPRRAPSVANGNPATGSIGGLNRKPYPHSLAPMGARAIGGKAVQGACA